MSATDKHLQAILNEIHRDRQEETAILNKIAGAVSRYAAARDDFLDEMRPLLSSDATAAAAKKLQAAEDAVNAEFLAAKNSAPPPKGYVQ